MKNKDSVLVRKIQISNVHVRPWMRMLKTIFKDLITITIKLGTISGRKWCDFMDCGKTIMLIIVVMPE